MSMTLRNLTEIEQAAEKVSREMHHLMERPSKAREALDELGEHFPELFEALDNLMVTTANDHQKKLHEAATELLAACGPGHVWDDEILIVLRDPGFRAICVNKAIDRKRAENAYEILQTLLSKN